MSGIENLWNEYWWILPLVCMALCFFHCIFRKVQDGESRCGCGWHNRDNQINRPH